MRTLLKKLFRIFTILMLIFVIALIPVGFYMLQQNINSLLDDNADLASQNDELEAEVLDLNQRNILKNQQIEELAKQLGLSIDAINNLKNENSNLNEENESLSAELTAINSQIDSTMSELDNYEQQITDSMAWFRDNATISPLSQYDSIKESLKQHCRQISGDSCTIKLSCLSFVNNQEHGFSYKLDSDTAAKDDFLQDLGQIYTNKGGDCEDYAQLAYAELNYLTESCQQAGSPNISYQSFTDNTGTSHHVTYRETYYIENTQDYDLPSDYDYYYPTCGSFPADLDPNLASTEGSYGHCLLAFSSSPIYNSSNVEGHLKSAILVEPQNGRVSADLRTDSRIEVPSNDYPAGDYYVFMVVTNADLYSFNAFKDSYRWYGYQDFLDEITGLKQALDVLN